MIDWRITVVGECTSTQDPLKAAAEKGEEQGAVLQSLVQTQGRGRHGNEWIGPMGNLYCSILLRPNCPADQAGQIAFIAALALSDAMDEFIDADKHSKTLKWPNDVLIDGQKVSGILLESALKNGLIDYLVLGTGVNILAPPEGAIGLDAVKKKPVPIHPFRDAYLEKLNDWLDGWKMKGFAPVRKAWLNKAHGLGQPMRIRLPEVSYEGIFTGIDEDGALLADIDGAEKRFTAGEVHFGV